MLDKFTISEGNSPTKLLFDKSKPTTLFPTIFTPYHEEIGVFKSHFVFHWLPFVLAYNFNNASFSDTETFAIIDTDATRNKNIVDTFFHDK